MKTTIVKAVLNGNYAKILLSKYPISYGFSAPHPDNPKSHTQNKEQIQAIAKKSAYRAKEKVKALIMGNLYRHTKYRPIFLTFTFRENVQDIAYANKEFLLAMKRLDYEVGHKLRYIAVPEFQERGAIHYHCIFFNLPFVDIKIIVKIWRHGTQVDIKPINKVKGTYHYLIKYLDKSFSDPRCKNKKRYLHSLENRTEIIYNQDTALSIFSKLDAKNWMSAPRSYDKLDQNGKITNHFSQQEFLTI